MVNKINKCHFLLYFFAIPHMQSIDIFANRTLEPLTSQGTISDDKRDSLIHYNNTIFCKDPTYLVRDKASKIFEVNLFGRVTRSPQKLAKSWQILVHVGWVDYKILYLLLQNLLNPLRSKSCFFSRKKYILANYSMAALKDESIWIRSTWALTWSLFGTMGFCWTMFWSKMCFFLYY